MLGESWSWGYGARGWRRRPGWGSRPGRKAAQTLPEREVCSPERHAAGLCCHGVASFRSQLTSVTPIAQIASATRVPGATSTSTWRSLATISSRVCLLLLMVILLRLARAILQGEPLQRGG